MDSGVRGKGRENAPEADSQKRKREITVGGPSDSREREASEAEEEESETTTVLPWAKLVEEGHGHTVRPLVGAPPSDRCTPHSPDQLRLASALCVRYAQSEHVFLPPLLLVELKWPAASVVAVLDRATNTSSGPR